MEPLMDAGRTVLLVEDDAARAGLLRHVMAGWVSPPRVQTVRTGKEALAYLRRDGAYAAAPRPHLVLLDLHLPGLDGRDVLRALKADPRLRRIPVVVMSASEEEDDVAACYDLHANGYVTKAFSLQEMDRDLRAIAGFWLETARLTLG